MIERIKDLAIIVRQGHGESGINFITPEENFLQFSILNHPKGHTIKAHIHKDKERVITKVQEVLYVEKGAMKVDLYNSFGKFVCDRLLTKGDTIILIEGGHGFSFQEDTRVIYTKQGPYYGKSEDKELL